MTLKTTSSQPTEPGSEHSIEVFKDNSTQTPDTPVTPRPGEENSKANGENNLNYPARGSGPLGKSDTKCAVDTEPAICTPLAEVTLKAATRPRSLPSALAKIARFQDELDACKEEIENLKGTIFGYQDALYQADIDASYFD